jgi:diaminopimelate epimerase
MTAPNDGQRPPSIPFTKASACGNDFLLIDGAHVAGDLSAMTHRLCDRHRGIGADGVEWLFPDDESDVRAILINADGSKAEISGNGTRCVAAEVCSRQNKQEIVVRTDAGLITCRLLARNGSTFEFETNMGKPKIGGELTIELASGETPSVRMSGVIVSMGNPHFVITVAEFPDAWQREAATIGRQPLFPDGTNVEFAVVRGPNEIEVRIFERGVGETQSSGTGSCASAVAAIVNGRIASPVKVVAPGGLQTVRWENEVYLQGPATLICHGEFFV